MTELPPEVEQQLASMTDGEWSAFTARVRAPDSTEALRTAAGKHLSGDTLNSFVQVADVSKFAGADGGIDETKVARHIGVLFPRDGQGQWGQHSAGGEVQGLRAGDLGRIEAARRHGRQLDDDTASRLAQGQHPKGANGRAEAARRKGNRR